MSKHPADASGPSMSPAREPAETPIIPPMRRGGSPARDSAPTARYRIERALVAVDHDIEMQDEVGVLRTELADIVEYDAPPAHPFSRVRFRVVDGVGELEPAGRTPADVDAASSRHPRHLADGP